MYKADVRTISFRPNAPLLGKFLQRQPTSCRFNTAKTTEEEQVRFRGSPLVHVNTELLGSSRSTPLWPSSFQGMSSFNLNSGGGHGPAIDSLTLTAQSVGLTIEQLAAALASSSNLKELTTENGNDSQQQLAFSLYRTESLALYRRCMLLAGFEADAIEETSPEYLQFAFKAWQEEGKRIQEMMGTEINLQAPFSANMQNAQLEQEEAQAHAAAQVQAQMQAQAVQAQAQALALEQQQQQQQLLLHNHLQQQQQPTGLRPIQYYSDSQRLNLLNNNKNQLNL